MTDTITPAQIQKIHALLPNEIKHDKELKQDLIAQFTGSYEKSSTKDLTKAQAKSLIETLDGKPAPTPKSNGFASFDKNNKQHLYILSLCHQLGWEKFNAAQNRMVADLEQLKGWLQKYGYLHKPLMDYQPDELPRLVTQLEHVIKSEYNKKQQA